jgi:prolipoprotein diacylglyceryltransferase
MFILWPARSWLSHLKPGGLFLSFLVLSSFTKLVTEAVRGDSTLFLNQYRGIQFLYLGILLLSLWCLRSRLPNHNQQNDLDD